ncbi:hypothetical protein FSW04_10460 [Baekduia soli]|uniref:Uncharacterized protein n=1 Tax=Baekduia soli TaxID=496014 RepID=A0A5B8U4A7_9ACTN|nr:hypothetical protein [Baekduia soli]QEC47949.1 hypothetical protein FSW04_10460 [Baekduia soli]
MSTMDSTAGMTLGSALERRRLEVRAGRMEQVLAALRRRESIYAKEGAVPPPLRAAIRDFGLELDAVRGQLRDRSCGARFRSLPQR